MREVKANTEVVDMKPSLQMSVVSKFQEEGTNAKLSTAHRFQGQHDEEKNEEESSR